MTTNWLVSQTITYKHDRFLRGHIHTPFSCIVALSVLQSFACLSLTKPFLSSMLKNRFWQIRILQNHDIFTYIHQAVLHLIWAIIEMRGIKNYISYSIWSWKSKVHYIVGLIITGKRITTYSNNVNRIYSNINTFIHDIVQKYK